MQAVIVGWQIYDLTRDPLALGMIGLAEAIPFLSMSLFAGHIADLFPRLRIIRISTIVFAICSIMLWQFTWKLSFVVNIYGVWPIYLVVFLTGFARSFFSPSQVALMAQIVPRNLYVNSSTWNSTVFHIAAISGPALGGLLYGFFGIRIAFLSVVAITFASLIIFSLMRFYPLPERKKQEGIGFVETLTAGLKFVFSNQIILSAMALDMLAVLFGGATSMLPVFAREILHTGPQGLGFLRAAPAMGAVVMALFLAHKPPLKHAGTNLLIAVAGFGFCMIFFALSTNFYLSLALLFFSGLFDNVSVIIRHSVMQLFTPDAMRGRVAAVNSIFIGSSNEIGAFESGVAARLLKLVPSVIFGGCMTLIVVSAVTRFSPKLRKLNLLTHLSGNK